VFLFSTERKINYIESTVLQQKSIIDRVLLDQDFNFLNIRNRK